MPLRRETHSGTRNLGGYTRLRLSIGMKSGVRTVIGAAIVLLLIVWIHYEKEKDDPQAGQRDPIGNMRHWACEDCRDFCTISTIDTSVLRRS